MTIPKERIIQELQWELLPETNRDIGCMRRRVGVSFEEALYTGTINDEEPNIPEYLCKAQDWIIEDIQCREVHDWHEDGFFWAWWPRQHDNQS